MAAGQLVRSMADVALRTGGTPLQATAGKVVGAVQAAQSNKAKPRIAHLRRAAARRAAFLAGLPAFFTAATASSLRPSSCAL